MLSGLHSIFTWVARAGRRTGLIVCRAAVLVAPGFFASYFLLQYKLADVVFYLVVLWVGLFLMRLCFWDRKSSSSATPMLGWKMVRSPGFWLALPIVFIMSGIVPDGIFWSSVLGFIVGAVLLCMVPEFGKPESGTKPIYGWQKRRAPIQDERELPDKTLLIDPKVSTSGQSISGKVIVPIVVTQAKREASG